MAQSQVWAEILDAVDTGVWEANSGPLYSFVSDCER